MMTYVAAVLAIVVVILVYVCHRLWLASQDTGMQEYVFSLDKQLNEARQLLHEQDIVLSQVGELFDHAGVDLEHTEHRRAADDLKALGVILRTRRRYGGAFDITWAQQTLSELAGRYGIEPVGGGPFAIRELIRIAEEIFHRVLARQIAAESSDNASTRIFIAGSNSRQP